MRDRRDHRLLRHLHGELPPAEALELRRELARDPLLASRLAELEQLWQRLELPPAASPPPGYVARLARLAGDPASAGPGSLWGLGVAPPWARALVGASLATGVVLGFGVGGRLDAPGAGRSAAEPFSAVASPAARPAVGEPAATSGEAGPPPVAVPPSAASPPSKSPPQAEARLDGPPATAVEAPASVDGATDTVAAAEAAKAADAADAADAETLLGDASSSFSGGSTLAEAYWQAFGAGEVGW